MTEYLTQFRANGSRAAIVFIHGFTGKASTTWGNFPTFLLGIGQLASWDVFSVGYPSRFSFDMPGLWAADPDLPLVAQSLSTTLVHSPFDDYEALVIIAHSMGGIGVQRAILDTPRLAKRVDHLFLFGTPSGGLLKARFGKLFKRQIRDMASDSDFIRALTKDRSAWFVGHPPFKVHVIAGNRDEFVPATSSLQPFPRECWQAIDGNHLGIVNPPSPDSKAVQIVVNALTNSGIAPTAIDSAMIAVEQRQFRDTVDRLMGNAARLDDAALVTLALALDGVGRESEALEILKGEHRSTTDSMGVLAGRIKRRWLVERLEEDRLRARDLYSQALDIAERAGDNDQAYYHAINIAFLDLLVAPDGAPPTEAVKNMAWRALGLCNRCSENHWCLATKAEAKLMLGDLEGACTLYRAAMEKADRPRDVMSMFAQATRVAEHIYAMSEAERLAKVFGAD